MDSNNVRSTKNNMKAFEGSIQGGKGNYVDERQRPSENHDRNRRQSNMERAHVSMPTATCAVAKHKTDPRYHLPAPLPLPGPVPRNSGAHEGMVTRSSNLITSHAPHDPISPMSKAVEDHARPAAPFAHPRARNSCTALPHQGQPFNNPPVVPRPLVGANMQRPYSYHPRELQRVASLEKATSQTQAPIQTRHSAAPYWRQGMVLEQPPFPGAAYSRLQMPEARRSSHTPREQPTQTHRPADYHPLLSNPVQVPIFRSLAPSSLQQQNLTMPVSAAVCAPIRSPTAPSPMPTNRHPDRVGKGVPIRTAAVSGHPNAAHPAVGIVTESPTTVRRAQSSAFPKFVKPRRPSVLRRGSGGIRKKSVLMKKVKGKLSSTKPEPGGYEKRKKMVRENVAPSSQSNRLHVPRKPLPMLQGRDSFNGPTSGMESSVSAPPHTFTAVETANSSVTLPLPSPQLARRDAPRLSLQIPQSHNHQVGRLAANSQQRPLTPAQFLPPAPATADSRPKLQSVSCAPQSTTPANQHRQQSNTLSVQEYPQQRYYATTQHPTLRKSSVLTRKTTRFDIRRQGVVGLPGNQTVEVLDRIDEGGYSANEACHPQVKRAQGPSNSTPNARDGSRGQMDRSTSLSSSRIATSMQAECLSQNQPSKRLTAEPPRPEAMSLDDLAMLVASRHPSSPSLSFSGEERAGVCKQPRRLTKRLKRFSKMKFDTWKAC